MALVRVIEGDGRGRSSFHGDIHILHRLSWKQRTLPRFDHWTSVHKVIFNLDIHYDIFMVAVLYDDSQIATCVPLYGLQWHTVTVPPRISDIAMHRNLLWILSVAPKSRIAASCFSLHPEWMDELMMYLGVPNSTARHRGYLVNSLGKMLAEESGDASTPRGFHVWECEETGLVERTHLDGRALLVQLGFVSELSTDYPQAVSIRSEEMGEMESDCLYFLCDANAHTGFKYNYDSTKGKFVSGDTAMPLAKGLLL